MIVDPDFMDHWRTGMVADALSDPLAPIYILRLWAHCQERKSDTFVMPPAGLKAQCRCPAQAEDFERALIDAGFLARDGETIIVLGWAEKNASLIAAWGNGSKGGRPKKNPTGTRGKPMGNPQETHGQPIANPGETDKRREEKRGEDKNSPSLRSGECERAFSELPSMAGAVCITLRAKGIPLVNPSHPELLELLGSGADIGAFAAAAEAAVSRGKGNFAYVLAVVRGQAEDAKRMAANARASPQSQNRLDRQLETAALLTGSGRSQPKPIEAIDVESRILPS